MPAVDECSRVLKSQPHLQIPGFGESEIHRSVCKALSYQSAQGQGPVLNLVSSVRKSYWNTEQVSKAVAGGLEHVISVDNAAGYAELWHQAGNWYMVTGADPSQPSTVVSKGLVWGRDAGLKTPYWTVVTIPGIYKGMTLEDASAYFLNTYFGPNGLAKGGCGCGGRS